MDDNLLQISLNQGKHFKKKISKIKKLKEGFVSLEKDQEEVITPSHQGYVPVFKNMRQNTNLIKNTNQTNLNDLEQAQQKYNDLIQQYTIIQQKISNSSLGSVNRLSSNNPYLNKTVRFSSGHICYVTNQGVVKWIPSMDIWNSTNVPKNYTDINFPFTFTEGSTIPTNPPLIAGTPLKMGESIGNEGLNVYASKLINNPSSKYIGCYNDKPASTLISVVPVMNSSNTSNGINALASSVYLNNSALGPWAAFDGNPNTFWLSNDGVYNGSNGIYQGQSSTEISGVGNVRGEVLYLQSIPSNTVVTQYSITPRFDFGLTSRSPNSWYVIGLSTPPNMQWHVIDRQQNQNFRSKDAKVYNIKNPKNGYIDYVLLVDKVGNDDDTSGIRTIVQVAEWKLFTSSDYSMTDNKRAMIWNPSSIGYTTLDKCQDYAVENGYKYFGLQDVRTDGTAACLVSNDIDKSQMYGDASVQKTSIPLWSSNTSSDYPSSAQLNGDGSLTIGDLYKNLFTTGGVKGCESWGTLTVQSATYGGNCKAPIGNVTEQVAKLGCNWVESCSIPISNSTFGDPVPGCGKGVDIAYSCGSTPFSKHLDYAEGQTMIMDDCKKYMKDNCQFNLILQDDGNMSIYRGTDPSNNTDSNRVWSANTSGQQKAPNPDWVASKGKFGRNYITTGQGLGSGGSGEWIGSTDGSLKLMMETGGNLVLYTSETKSGCKVINNKTYGGSYINAIYQLNNAGNRNTLGKVGYINSDSTLMLYPDSMLETSNNYQIFSDSDSAGNDISNLTVKDQNECQIACNNNTECRAYTSIGTSCWLKNKNAYPKSAKSYATGATLGVRLPGLKGSTTCSNKIVDVDTIQFDNYIKGAAMTSTTQCNPSIVSDQDRIEFDNIKSQLITLGNDIVSKTQNLYNQDNNTFEKLNLNKEQFKKNIEKYKLTNIKIKKELNLQDNNIEGMQNLDINDVNGMLNDSDLRVLQQNYSYIMWSIFAIGTLTITINALKK
jgi:hypothetical protein